MNNELKKRRAIKTIIENQFRVLKLNGSTSKELTLSLPKVENVDIDVLTDILKEIFDYIPDIVFYQEIECIETTKVILITLRLK